MFAVCTPIISCTPRRLDCKKQKIGTHHLSTFLSEVLVLLPLIINTLAPLLPVTEFLKHLYTDSAAVQEEQN